MNAQPNSTQLSSISPDNSSVASQATDTGSLSAPSTVLDDWPMSRPSSAEQPTLSLQDPRPHVSTYTRTPRQYRELDSNSDDDPFGPTVPSIGNRFGTPPWEANLRTSTFVSEYAITGPSGEYLRTIANQWLLSERLQSTGAQLEWAKVEERGCMPAYLLILRYRLLSSGMDTRVKIWLLSMNLQEEYQSNWFSHGLTVTRYWWKSKEQPQYSEPLRYGSPATSIHGSGTRMPHTRSEKP